MLQIYLFRKRIIVFYYTYIIVSKQKQHTVPFKHMHVDCQKNEAPAAFLKRLKWGLGIPIHIKMIQHAYNIVSCIPFVLNRVPYVMSNMYIYTHIHIYIYSLLDIPHWMVRCIFLYRYCTYRYALYRHALYRYGRCRHGL